MRKIFLLFANLLVLSGCVTEQTRAGQPYTPPAEPKVSAVSDTKNGDTSVRVLLVPRKDNPEHYDYRLQEVFPKTMYSRMGFKSGDVILNIDGKPIQTMTDVLNAPGKLSAGDFEQILVRRGGKNIQLKSKRQ